MRNTRLANLDGLRGVAAVAVMLGHACEEFNTFDFVPRHSLAVDFFFLLSGYIMARTYQERLDAGHIVDFLRARLIRLWPVLVIGVVLASVAAAIVGNTSGLAESAALALLCLPNLASTQMYLFAFNPPQWSLFYEAAANVVHALVGRRVPFLWLLAFAGLCAAVLVWTARAVHNFHFGDTRQTFWLGFARVGFSYALGVLLFRLKLPKMGIPLPLAAVAMFGIFALPQGISAAKLDALAIVVVWPVLLVLSAHSPARAGWMTRIALLLGELSYPLYILHWPLIHLIAHYQVALGLSSWPTLVAACVAAIAVAFAASRFIDIPVRAMLTNLTRSRAAQH